MKRRDFLRSMGAGLGVFALGQLSNGRPRKAAAATNKGCRLVVFGSDSLGIEYARTLRRPGVPALSSLERPICSLNGGSSVTQPGWATIWSGLPSYYNGAYSNKHYGAMPENVHIVGKIINDYADQDLSVVWITGKGNNIRGNLVDSPHYAVYDAVVNQGHPGVYYGDEGRKNHEVYRLAVPALKEAVRQRNFIAFVHFHDPDATGHRSRDYATYMQAARRVDRYIWALMQLLSDDTDVIYCSDHGFGFKELGDVKNSHAFNPWGMFATNFSILDVHCTEQASIGRLIYKRAGGDPHHCWSGDLEYSMYGIDLV